MALPNFKKGQLLKAKDLQAIADAVRAAAPLPSTAAGHINHSHKQPQREPATQSNTARINDGFDYSCCYGPRGKLTVYPPSFRLFQDALEKQVAAQAFCSCGTIVAHIKTGCEGQLRCINMRCLPPSTLNAYTQCATFWDGYSKEGCFYLVLGCLLNNPCTSCNAEQRLYYRPKLPFFLPIIPVNPPGDCGVCLVHTCVNNASKKIRRLTAGAGVTLDKSENSVLIDAPGAVRPHNPAHWACYNDCNIKKCDCTYPESILCLFDSCAEQACLVGCRDTYCNAPGVKIRSLVEGKAVKLRQVLDFVQVNAMPPINPSCIDHLNCQATLDSCYFVACLVDGCYCDKGYVIRKLVGHDGIKVEQKQHCIHITAPGACTLELVRAPGACLLCGYQVTYLSAPGACIPTGACSCPIYIRQTRQIQKITNGQLLYDYQILCINGCWYSNPS